MHTQMTKVLIHTQPSWTRSCQQMRSKLRFSVMCCTIGHAPVEGCRELYVVPLGVLDAHFMPSTCSHERWQGHRELEVTVPLFVGPLTADTTLDTQWMKALSHMVR